MSSTASQIDANCFTVCCICVSQLIALRTSPLLIYRKLTTLFWLPRSLAMLPLYYSDFKLHGKSALYSSGSDLFISSTNVAMVIFNNQICNHNLTVGTQCSWYLAFEVTYYNASECKMLHQKLLFCALKDHWPSREDFVSCWRDYWFCRLHAKS